MRTPTILLTLLLTAACGPSVETGPVVDAVAEPERWSSADDPAIFSATLERRLEALPTAGEPTKLPWTGSYWATAQDSINHRWDGPMSESPAAKYGRAYGIADLEDRVSRDHGLESVSGTPCSFDLQCDARLGEICGRRTGELTGRCVPTWWGICHAWAPAATLHPEPRVPVTVNGVTFKVQDIKALLSLVYDQPLHRFASLRCNENDEGGEIDYDPWGRPSDADAECRDTNPGTYHLLLANFLGLRNQGFVEDQRFDYQVWTYPLRSYRVLSQRPVTFQEAAGLVGDAAPGEVYRFNPDARAWAYLETEVRYIELSPSNLDGPQQDRIDQFTGVTRYTYVLELDAEGRVIGGEWVGASKRRHPDFVWLPLGTRSQTVAEGAIRFDVVKRLADASAN